MMAGRVFLVLTGACQFFDHGVGGFTTNSIQSWCWVLVAACQRRGVGGFLIFDVAFVVQFAITVPSWVVEASG